MRVLVTGAAGFIGSSLTDRLLSLGHTVIGVDNLSTGQPEFLEGAKANPLFTLREHDLLDLDALVESATGDLFSRRFKVATAEAFCGFNSTDFL